MIDTGILRQKNQLFRLIVLALLNQAKMSRYLLNTPIDQKKLGQKPLAPSLYCSPSCLLP